MAFFLSSKTPLVICLIAIFIWSFPSQAAWENLKALETQGAKVSTLIVGLDSQEVISEYNSEQKLTPASLSKIILGSAALETWGSNHTFTTKIYGKGNIINGVLNGSLIVQGAGDPYLTNEMLWFLCTDVARFGIREVTGNLVLNTSLFGNIIADANRAAGKVFSSHAYDSPLSAVAVNFSVLAAVVSPNSMVGKYAKVSLEPYELDNVKINSTATTVENGSGNKISASRSRVKNIDNINVSGGISISSFPVRTYRSVSDADEYAGNVFRAFLSHAGVKINGKIEVDKDEIAPNLRPVAQVEGYPLEWQIRGLFKVSNNFIADMLTINLDTITKKGGATFAGGAKKLQDYSTEIIAKSKFKSLPKAGGVVLVSGSGLTPENRLSAKDLVAVLNKMYSNAREFPAFLSAFPIMGSEGTVKKRFSGKDMQVWRNLIRAKTGTLTDPYDAVGLSGYARTLTGRWIAFAVIVNGTRYKTSFGVERIRESIDEDLVLLLSDK